jgi:type II secretory pathway pseudopilin PulG
MMNSRQYAAGSTQRTAHRACGRAIVRRQPLHSADCPLPTADCLLPTARRGFSFVEILFAVIILGVGFIMVAAMFPVAIRQSQANVEDAAGIAVWRNGQSYVKALGPQIIDTLVQAGEQDTNGEFRPLPYPVWNLLAGSMIIDADPRLAWVPVGYRSAPLTGLGGPSASAEIYVIAVQSRNAPRFGLPDVAFEGNLYPRRPASQLPLVEVQKGDVADRIHFVNDNEAQYAAAGTYVLIADAPAPYKSLIGRIYQLGTREGSTNIWNMLPGKDMEYDRNDAGNPIASGTTIMNLRVLILGRGFRQPDDEIPEGNAMDLFTPRSAISVRK